MLELTAFRYGNLDSRPIAAYFQPVVREIQLTQNKVALVDDTDYDYLMQWKWCAFHNHGRNWYAVRTDRTGEKQSLIRMHNLLFSKGADHKNGNGLDNQRNNLRQCTCAQNGQNRNLNCNSASGFKGVSKDGANWRVRLNINQVQTPVGRFKRVIDAAVAYDQAALRHFGEFARLNFSYDPACYI